MNSLRDTSNPINTAANRATAAPVCGHQACCARIPTTSRCLSAGSPNFCSNVQTKVSCNNKHYDYDANDVENIHYVLRLRLARPQYEVTMLQTKTFGM